MKKITIFSQNRVLVVTSDYLNYSIQAYPLENFCLDMPGSQTAYINGNQTPG